MRVKERSRTATPQSGEEKSLGSHAAERHLMVAAGFSPRTGAAEESRRVATVESTLGLTVYRSTVATRRPPYCRRDRGLKPTATITSSLRDEIKTRSSPVTPFPDVLSR